MKKIFLVMFLMILTLPYAFADDLEAGKGDLAVTNICQGTTGETVQKTFYPNGSLDVKAYCKDGQLNGVVKKYTAAGKIRMKADYLNGQLHGTAKLHDINGNILFSDEYANGARTKRSGYDAKGELIP
ncbi:MAG: hypothetical protein HQL22_03125 [Candidatus Omnitrophica bacterium]|nr:hypothetical protein [Candidatus Omnitrophota bacterium]